MSKPTRGETPVNHIFRARDFVDVGTGTAAHAFPLALAGAGERLRIAAIRSGKGFTRKLGDLGLGRGSEIRILQRRPGGAMVVGRDMLRIAIGAGAAQRVMVTLVAEDDTEKPAEEFAD